MPSTKKQKQKTEDWGREEHTRPSASVWTLYLLLRGQGVREVQEVRGGREVQAVQGCHLGQGGLRVPEEGEGGQGECRPGATAPPAHNGREPSAYLPLGLGGRCLLWVPLELGEKK